MAGKVKDLPLRTCIACRREGTKSEFLRFVLGPGNTVVADLNFKLPGRGAYTCLDPQCLAIAVQRRQFDRAFKKHGEIGTKDELVAEIRRLVIGRLMGVLALANKAGMVVSGGDSVERILATPLPGGIVWVAADASLDRQQKYSFLGIRAGCTVQTGFTSVELGELLGKEQRTFLLLKPSGIIDKLRNELERFRKFIDGGAQEP